MKFELNDAQVAKLTTWNDEQDAIVLAQQRQEIADDGDSSFPEWLIRRDRPYYGAVGGHLTFSFTPTSIGNIVKVKHSGTDAELDLSDEGGFG